MIVTVVTPSLNGREFLTECVESVRSQVCPGVAVEHVVVDGGSTDGTPELARALGCRVLSRDEPSLYAGINKGSRLARGQLLGTLGCDDMMLPGAVAAVVEAHEKTGARFLYGGYRWLTERGYRGVVLPPRRIPACMFASHEWSAIPHCSVFLTADLFAELGGYDPTFTYLGDFELLARIIRGGEPAVRIDRPLYVWRRHGTNLSQSRHPRIRVEAAEVQRRHGPSAGWVRYVNRTLLRLWLNGRNPGWFARKRLDSLRDRRTCTAGHRPAPASGQHAPLLDKTAPTVFRRMKKSRDSDQFRR